MKRFIIFFLLCVLLATSTYATGDSNVDSGGGGMGSGSSSAYWNPGWDGVRVTVTTPGGAQVSTPIDLTNKTVAGSIRHFGKQTKLYYRSTLSVTPNTNTYSCINPVDQLPTIVSSSGGNNIEAIKTYFTDTGHLQEIASYVGMSYDDMIGGDYKLMLEPIAYFTYNNLFYAMTATEAALFDVMTDNNLYAWMKSLTHKNLPLSMFLENDDWDIGITTWRGSTTSFQSNLDIIKYLGVGIVRFTEVDEVVADPLSDYTYRTDTDVITTISFTNTWGEISPDNSAYVVFNINGVSYSKEFICPDGGHQMVWVRWHTPDTPQVITVTTTCAMIGLSTDITCNIVELEEAEPPDPGYYDASVEITASAPDYGTNTSTTWGEWFATWHENWVWISVPVYDADSGSYFDAGYWEDQGWWDWSYETYTATLAVDYELAPDDRVQTAIQSGDDWEMKSAYGLDATCKVVVSRSSGASSYDTTSVQNVVAVFPEFNYDIYNRLLEDTGLLHGYNTWRFKENKYSYHSQRAHFTPLWYPDDTEYTVPLNVMDAWTPGGQLYTTVSDYVTINGDAYDDGYIQVLK